MSWIDRLSVPVRGFTWSTFANQTVSIIQSTVHHRSDRRCVPFGWAPVLGPIVARQSGVETIVVSMGEAKKLVDMEEGSLEIGMGDTGVGKAPYRAVRTGLLADRYADHLLSGGTA
ncbi:hypothetical protein B296_00002915 [Ensete ventricosum]|uniref:Uncharacterized protein n=1 Tax=Ensete ventricosum TaxID=4639 RepID=A0A426Z9Z5_ENSVE|nr:hypothetical protein B296_00002915 [Ensete ventricosum]